MSANDLGRERRREEHDQPHAPQSTGPAFLLWAGAVGYALYNDAFYVLGAALNVFFPFYVVSVVLAAVILMLTLGPLDPSSLALNVRPIAPVPLIGAAFVSIGVGLASVWIAMWAAYIFAGRPTPVDPDAFRLVAALDLSLYLAVLSINSFIAIRHGVAAWPGELVIWGSVGSR
jgi:hypothetical protein